MAIQEQVDLKPHNSFGVPAKAAYYAVIKGPADLTEGLDFARERHLNTQVLGGGSNILFINDYPGLILHLDNKGVDWLGQGRVKVAAGENWHQLVIQCLKKSQYGVENLALIPGTVGAAPIQNIGAYGVELADVFLQAEVFDCESGEVRVLDKTDCEFAYRDSVFKHEQGQNLVILSVTLQLGETWRPQLGYKALADAFTGRQASAQQVFDKVCEIRSSKLPDPKQLGNAGSFFKNPLVSEEKCQSLIQEYPDLPIYQVEDEGLVKISAAWLLEQAGWRGKQRGRAAVHAEHSLVLVNPGQASGEDILLLAQEMSSSVLSRYGIALQPEVRII